MKEILPIIKFLAVILLAALDLMYFFMILHEFVLFACFAMMLTATIFSKNIPQIIIHPFVLLLLLAGGYGIFKTVKSIKNMDRHNADRKRVKYADR